MAARDTVVDCPEGEWTQVTDTATGDVTICVNAGQGVLRGVAGIVAPATEGGISMTTGDGWSEATIEQKFPGVTGADNLFFKAGRHGAKIFVSHAA